MSVICMLMIIALIRLVSSGDQFQRNGICKKTMVERKRWWPVWEKTGLSGTWGF